MEIGIFSNFGEEDKIIGFGPELVVNGGMDSNSDWFGLPAGFVITGGKLVVTAGIGRTYQVINTIVGKHYRYSLVISGFASGGIQLNDGLISAPLNGIVDGFYFYDKVCTRASYLYIECGANSTLNVDGVSVREIIEN